MNASGAKACVIGLDGATFSVLDKWVASGDMPNLADLMERGSRTVLTSTLPPVTGPAWTSMVTGVNPGSHGIFDFFKWSPDGVTGRLINSRDVPLPRIWDVAGAAGRTVGVFSVPVTFPAWPVNGFMVAGMLTPAPGPAMTHPASVYEDLVRQGLSPAGEPLKEGTDRQLALSVLEKHKLAQQTVAYMLERYRPDFFMGVFVGPDRLQHKLWRYCAQEEGADDRVVRRHVRQYFREADATIGIIRRTLGDDATFYIVSDHGFGPLLKTCRLNNYLVQRGFLTFDARRWRRIVTLWRAMLIVRSLVARVGLLGPTRRVLKWLGSRYARRSGRRLSKRWPMSRVVDWTRTRAYHRSRSECGIVVNVRGKCANGIVNPGEEYDRVVEDLIEALEELRDPESGNMVAQHVFRREQAFTGPWVEEAPDLYVLSNGLYNFDSVMGGPLFQKAEWSGTHRVDGVLIACGPGVKHGAQPDAHIADVAPTALYGMGLGVPAHMDGKVLTDLFDDAFLAAHPVEYCDHEGPPFGSDSGPSHPPELDADVVARLRRLGYL